MRIILVGVMALGLGGCSAESMINMAYADRDRFTFQSSDGEDTISYVCAKGSSDADTLKRARAAHGYVDGQMISFAEKYGAEYEAAIASGVSERKADQRLDAAAEVWAEGIVNSTEERYQCLPFA